MSDKKITDMEIEARKLWSKDNENHHAQGKLTNLTTDIMFGFYDGALRNIEDVIAFRRDTLISMEESKEKERL